MNKHLNARRLIFGVVTVQTTLADLETFVAKPTWREMLFDLVATQKLDPWNIDVGVVTEKYLEKIRALKTLDLHLPANIILAASILLRFKSDSLRFQEEVQEAIDETYIEENAVIDIPMISLRTRIPPKRTITLQELVSAMETVIQDQKRRQEKPIIEPEIIAIELPSYNLEEKMGELMEKIRQTADAEGLVTFTSLIAEKQPRTIVETLLPLLHLSQEARIMLIQEKIFQEIFIQMIGDGTAKPKRKRGEAA